MTTDIDTGYAIGQQIAVRTDTHVFPYGSVKITPMATIVGIEVEKTFMFGTQLRLTLRADDDFMEIFGTKKGETFAKTVKPKDATQAA